MALPYDAAELQRRDPIQSLFDLALGLTPPWRVVGFMFDPDRHPLDIQVGFEPAVRFACPECGATGCPVHDTTAKEWRHLNFFEHEAYLHAKVPRVRCDRHGVRQVGVPWAREGSGFTLLFEALGHGHDAGDAGEGGGQDRGRARHPALAHPPALRGPGASE